MASLPAGMQTTKAVRTCAYPHVHLVRASRLPHYDAAANLKLGREQKRDRRISATFLLSASAPRATFFNALTHSRLRKDDVERINVKGDAAKKKETQLLCFKAR